MIHRNLRIQLVGSVLNIEGIYYPLLNEFDNVTPENASFEVEKVFYECEDITILLTELEAFGFDFAKIELACLEKISEE